MLDVQLGDRVVLKTPRGSLVAEYAPIRRPSAGSLPAFGRPMPADVGLGIRFTLGRSTISEDIDTVIWAPTHALQVASQKLGPWIISPASVNRGVEHLSTVAPTNRPVTTVGQRDTFGGR